MTKEMVKVLALCGHPENIGYHETCLMVMEVPTEALELVNTISTGGVHELTHVFVECGEDEPQWAKDLYNGLALNLQYGTEDIKHLLDAMPTEFFKDYADYAVKNDHSGEMAPMLPQHMTGEQLTEARENHIHHTAVTQFHAHLIAKAMGISNFWCTWC